MNPFGTRGAADFANALDGGTAGTLPGLALAARLRTVGASLDVAVAPRPEFRDALRMRLMAVAAVQADAPAATVVPLSSALSWRRRTGAVAAGAMASVVAVSGVAVAGSQSLPGDPFYGVKKSVEAFQLSTADGDLEKGAQHLEFAATRLREVRGLTLGRDAVDQPQTGSAAIAATADPEVVARVKQTLVDMDDQTREGTALLNDAFRTSRAPEPLRVLGTFAERQQEGLQQLLPALPPRTQDRARISLALLAGVSAEAEELLGIGTCANGCDPTQAAPSLPTAPGAAPTPTTAPCDCAAPVPAPAPGPTAPSEPTADPAPEPAPEPTGESSSQPTPRPSSPAPSPSPTSGMPVPLPSLPVPVPSLPVPVPTLTLAPLAPVVEAVLPGTSGSTSSGSTVSAATSSGSAPAPVAPAPTPLAAVEPVTPRR